jgi:hypothetical protein
MCVRREPVVGQGVTVKAEARIDLVYDGGFEVHAGVG